MPTLVCAKYSLFQTLKALGIEFAGEAWAVVSTRSCWPLEEGMRQLQTLQTCVYIYYVYIYIYHTRFGTSCLARGLGLCPAAVASSCADSP